MFIKFKLWISSLFYAISAEKYFNRGFIQVKKLIVRLHRIRRSIQMPVQSPWSRQKSKSKIIGIVISTKRLTTQIHKRIELYIDSLPSAEQKQFLFVTAKLQNHIGRLAQRTATTYGCKLSIESEDQVLPFSMLKELQMMQQLINKYNYGAVLARSSGEVIAAWVFELNKLELEEVIQELLKKLPSEPPRAA